MSLAEQIQRVDGGQNDTLKAILTALGVTVGTQKIDQLAALAATISPKLKPDNLNSAETNALYGLGTDAVPDDVLTKISEMIDSTNDSLEASKTNSAVGTFTSSVTLPFTPDAVWVAVNLSDSSGSGTTSGFLYPGVSHYLNSNNRYVRWSGTRISGAGGGTFRYVALKFGGNS